MMMLPSLERYKNVITWSISSIFKAVNFEFDDFIHIREKFDDDWWIGRVISHDHNMGFIPSPVKIEKIRHSKKNKRNGKMDFEVRAERTIIVRESGMVFVKPIIRDLSRKNR